MTLSAEQRRKVAEECTGYKCRLSVDSEVLVVFKPETCTALEYSTRWRPESTTEAYGIYANGEDESHAHKQKDALVRKVAQLLCHERVQSTDTLRLKNKLVHALADNDVNAIEALCYELLGDNDG